MAGEQMKKSSVAGVRPPRTVTVALAAAGGNRIALEGRSVETLVLVQTGAPEGLWAGGRRRGRRHGNCGYRKGCIDSRKSWRKRRREQGGAGTTFSKPG